MDNAMVGTEHQHLRALEHANRVRLARARMKRRIASGELPVAEVILSPPWEAQSMKISELLMSQRRWGSTRCGRVLRSLGVPENKPVGTLTDRQRLALTALLPAERAPDVERADRPELGTRPMARERALSAA